MSNNNKPVYQQNRPQQQNGNNNRNNNNDGYQTNINTRARIQPSKQSRLSFTITTSQAQAFLQQSIDEVTRGTRLEGTSIILTSTEASNKYIPFIGIFEANVQKEEIIQMYEGIEPIFISDTTEKEIFFEDYIFNLLKRYIYTLDDIKAFNSDAWRRAINLSRQKAATLKNICRAKSVEARNGEYEYIIVLINPISVFYSMLAIQGDTRPYNIEIKKLIKLRAGEFKYVIDRNLISSKNKDDRYSEKLKIELERKVMGNSVLRNRNDRRF